MHIEFFEGLHDNARNGEIAKPFVIGRNDEPGSIFGAAAGEHSFVGGDIIVPALSLYGIGFGEFPFLARIVQPLLETLFLFFPANVQKNLRMVTSFSTRFFSKRLISS